jgi:murein L,D-transpeptidase YcbB/YkuD
MQRRFLLLALALLALAPRLAAQEAPLRIDLNIPENRLVVWEGDRILRTYPVSVGMVGHDTPDGSFEITHAEWNPWWRPPEREWARGEKPTPPGPNNPMGRVKLFFMPLYFFHGTPDAENIGQPASHGCVRLLNKDVVALARLLHERAAPQVTPKQIDAILAKSRETRRVNFRTPVPVTIRYDLVVVQDTTVRVLPDVYKRNTIHAEGVYQALLAAGYDISALSREQVARFVETARKSKKPFATTVAKAFGPALPRRATALH